MFALSLQIEMLKAYGSAIKAGLAQVAVDGCGTMHSRLIAALIEELEALLLAAEKEPWPPAALADLMPDLSQANLPEVLGRNFVRRVRDLPDLCAYAVQAVVSAARHAESHYDQARQQLPASERASAESLALLAKQHAACSLREQAASFERACEPLSNLLIAMRIMLLSEVIAVRQAQG